MHATMVRSCGIALVILCFGVIARAAPPSVGERAPKIGLEKLLQAPDGAVASWKALKGNVVVLEFWATWCGPCVAAIPHLNELAEKYAGKGVQFIAITDEKEELIQEFLKKKPIHAWVGLDTDHTMKKAYGVTGIPHTVLVGRDGVILGITYPEGLTERVLDDALAGRKVSVPTRSTSRGLVSGRDVDENGAEPPLYQILIRPYKPGANGMASGMAQGNGGLTLDGYSLKELFATAYDFQPGRVVMDAGHDKLFTAVVLAPTGRTDDAFPMLRQALESTFHRRTRTEKRMTDACVLQVADSGSKLSVAISGGQSSSGGAGRLEAIGLDLDSLAKNIETMTKKPVVNETGLPGRYDLRLKWKEGNEESLVEALREQAGLTLSPAKRRIKFLIVEPGDKKD